MGGGGGGGGHSVVFQTSCRQEVSNNFIIQLYRLKTVIPFYEEHLFRVLDVYTEGRVLQQSIHSYNNASVLYVNMYVCVRKVM